MILSIIIVSIFIGIVWVYAGFIIYMIFLPFKIIIWLIRKFLELLVVLCEKAEKIMY